MTIEESIAYEREKAKEQRYYTHFEKNNLMRQSCLKCAEEHEQRADWLEELSRRRVEELFRKTNEKAIRDKAIDDFVNECICYEHLTFEQEHIERIQAIGEQLKAGANNE